jgi:large subunit ribosomal protein L29
MKIQAMLDWSPEEKAAKVREWTQSLFTLRLQKATGQLENPMKIKQLRKDIARLKTAQHMSAAEVATAAAHEVHPATTEGSEETVVSKGKEAAAAPKQKGAAGAGTPSGKGAKKRAAAAKASQKKTAGAAAKAHSPSKKSSSAGAGKKGAAPKAKSASAKTSKKK